MFTSESYVRFGVFCNIADVNMETSARAFVTISLLMMEQVDNCPNTAKHKASAITQYTASQLLLLTRLKARSPAWCLSCSLSWNNRDTVHSITCQYIINSDIEAVILRLNSYIIFLQLKLKAWSATFSHKTIITFLSGVLRNSSVKCDWFLPLNQNVTE